ncbi:MAG: GWxTD domain-containing protein [Gemmatimonadota bacterium]
MKRLILPILVAALLPTSVLGQRVRLDAVRERLAVAMSVPELRQREANLADSSGLSVAALERGLVLIRLYELTLDEHDAEAARAAFEEVLRQDSSIAYAHFGLGLALLKGPGGEGDAPRGFILDDVLAEARGRDPMSLAGHSFARALELDPTFEQAALELAHVALERGERDGLLRARDLLARFNTAPSVSASVALAVSAVEAALGNRGAAAAAATRARDAGADPALSLLAEARALLPLDDRRGEGARAYRAGLDALTPAAAAAYWEDVAIIARPDEEASWKAAGTLEERTELLRQFWAVRAAYGGVTEEERIGEHYQRLATALERFRREGRGRGAPPAGALLRQDAQARPLPLDDRGVVLVRHGDPDAVVQTPSSELRPNEMWVYHQPDGSNALYHFVVLRESTDYRLVPDIMSALDPTVTNFPADAIVRLLEDRARYEPAYKNIASRIESWQRKSRMAGLDFGRGAMEADRDADALLEMFDAARVIQTGQTRSATLDGLSRDSDRPDFEEEVPYYYDLYAFQGAAGLTDLTAAAAVPARVLEGRTMNGVVVYGVDLSFIVVDTLTDHVTRADTTLHYRSDRVLGPRDHVRVHVSLAAPPSASVIHRMVIRDANRPSAGKLYGAAQPVPAFHPAGLDISDIVLAEPDSGTWSRGEAHLGLVPPRQFEEGAALNIFYEVYGLEADAAYRTEVVLEATEKGLMDRIKGLFGGGGALRLTFDGVADPDAAGATQELRHVVPSVGQGRYRIEVTVTDLDTGRVATRETVFLVIDP